MEWKTIFPYSILRIFFHSILKIFHSILKSESEGYGSLRAKHPAAGRLFGKNCYFNAIWITFRTFSEPFERTKFLRFDGQLNTSLPLLQVKFKTHLKSYILGLNFVTWPKSGKSRYIAFCNIFSIKQCT